MRAAIVRILLASALLLSPLGAAAVSANHFQVVAVVNIWHGDKPVASYRATFPCSGNACATDVTVNNRDYGRFVRWCGTEARDVMVRTGLSQGLDQCFGSAAWRIELVAVLQDASGTQVTHVEDVRVNIHVLK